MTTSQRLPAGTRLGGRYRLLEPLPGAGRSWHARDEVDRRDLVARVVVLPAAMPAADRDLARQRALRDATLVSRVRHPGIAPVVDAVVEDGTPWVISVRPGGRSLGDVVRTNGPLPTAVAALVGLQVLDALVAAGVPHGDLTPDDVLRALGTSNERLLVLARGACGADDAAVSSHIVASRRVPVLVAEP